MKMEASEYIETGDLPLTPRLPKDHCLFCLERHQHPGLMVTRNEKNVEFQTLLDQYIISSKSGKKKLASIKDLPPLCRVCYDKLGEMQRLHGNLQEIQRLIQNVAFDIRQIVRVCRDKSKLDTFRANLLQRSSSTSAFRDEKENESILEFIKDIHGLIIAEDDPPLVQFNDVGISMEVDTDPDYDYDPDHDHFEAGPADFVKVEHPSSDENDDNENDHEPLFDNENEAADSPSENEDLKPTLEPETARRRSSRISNISEQKKVHESVSKKSKPVDTEQSIKKPFKCDYEGCNRSFGAPQWVSHHKKKAHGEFDKFPCKFCSNTYQTKILLRAHIGKRHREQWAEMPKRVKICSLLPYALEKPPDNSDIEVQRCPLCSKKIWVELSKMDLHMEAHLGTGRQGWKCPKCSEVYPTRSMILNHFKTNPECSNNSGEIQKHICPLCQPQQNEFETETDLFNHVFNLHEKDESLEKSQKCKNCDKQYRTELGLDFHTNFHVQDKKWNRDVRRGHVPCPCLREDTRCKLCSEVVASHEMEAHLSTEHKMENHQFIRCKLCNDVVVDAEDYLCHLKTLHCQIEKRELKPCHICEFEASERVFDLRRHYFHFHQIGSQFICEHCSATFYAEKSLQYHIKDAHEKNVTEFACEFCLKCGDIRIAYLASKESLEQHLAKVHPVDRFKCKRLQCTAQFRCRADFMEHEKTDHQDDPLICSDPSCSTQFVHAIYLKNHMEVVHKGKNRSSAKCTIYECSVCGKGFRDACKLKGHENVHTSVKSFQCEHCPKSYKTEQHFKHHQLTHLPGGRPRPFVCDVCSQAFFTNKMMEQHKRIHTGERPFSCQFCGTRFRQQSSLRTHEMGHKQKQEKFKGGGIFERGSKSK